MGMGKPFDPEKPGGARYWLVWHTPTASAALSPKVESRAQAWRAVFPDMHWVPGPCGFESFRNKPDAETALLVKRRELDAARAERATAEHDPEPHLVAWLEDMVKEGDRHRTLMIKKTEMYGLVEALSGASSYIAADLRGRWAKEILEVAKAREWDVSALLRLVVECLREKLVEDEFNVCSSCALAEAMGEVRRYVASKFAREARSYLSMVEHRDEARERLGLLRIAPKIDPKADVRQILH